MSWISWERSTITASRAARVSIVVFGPFLADFLRLVDGRRELGTIWDTILRSAKGQHEELSQKQLVRLLLPDWEIVNAMNWVVLRHRSTPEIRPVEATATFRVQVDGA